MIQSNNISLIILFLLSSNHFEVYCYWGGGNVVGSRYGAMGAGGRGSTVGSISSIYPGNRMANLPAGMVNIGGELVDITNKIIQKSNGAGGTQYYSYINQKTGPIFSTPTVDIGKHFVVFQDVNYPSGDGHYIILRRWRGPQLGATTGGSMYEAFYLDLGDSINALVSNWNFASYVPGGNMLGSVGGLGGRSVYARNINRLTRAAGLDSNPKKRNNIENSVNHAHVADNKSPNYQEVEDDNVIKEILNIKIMDD